MDTIIAAVFFGIVGSAYILYGRRTLNPVALVAGVLLCAFPYFVDTFLWTMVVGIVLLAAPFVISY